MKNENESDDEESIGVPQQVPDSFVPVQKPEAEDKTEIDEIFRDSSEEEISNHKFFNYSLLWSVGTLLFAAFSIIILSEIFQFINAVQSSPTLFRYTAYTCILIIGLILCWSLGRLLFTFRGLSKSPQFSLNTISSVHNRSLTRDQIGRQLDSGYEALYSLVESYPISDQKQISLLQKSGFDETDLKKLKSNIDFLLNGNSSGKTKWILDCENLFISQIDSCAKNRVNTYAKRVALKTALSPIGLIDSLIVAVNSVLMVEELCILYNVRTNRWNSIVLTGKLVFNTFISARLEDQLDAITDVLFENAISNIATLSQDLFSKISLGVLKRTSEGAVNMALFYKLGAATMLSLRPIRRTS